MKTITMEQIKSEDDAALGRAIRKFVQLAPVFCDGEDYRMTINLGDEFSHATIERWVGGHVVAHWQGDLLSPLTDQIEDLTELLVRRLER